MSGDLPKNLPASLSLPDLAAEIAVQYFPEDVLCFRHNITQHQLTELKMHPELRRLVQDEQKAIAMSGEAFRLKAAAKAESIMNQFAAMAEDENVPYSQRIKAGELVAQWAGGGYGGNAKEAGGLGMQILLQTNLALEPLRPTGGEYEVESINVEEDLIG